MQGTEFDEAEFFRSVAASGVSTVDGVRVSFDEVWSRRRGVRLAPDVDVFLPTLDDLILTKRLVG